MTDKYIEAEKRLAELLKYDDIIVGTGFGFGIPTLYATEPNGDLRGSLPRWIRDNAAAFALMVKQKISIDISGDEWVATLTHYGMYGVRNNSELYSDHPDKETAVRYAIVMAVIAKLEAK